MTPGCGMAPGSPGRLRRSSRPGCGVAGVGVAATFTGFSGLVGMGIALGSGIGAAFSLAIGGAGLGVSEVRTLSGFGWARGGSGSELTMVAWMAPAVFDDSPQALPW